MKMKNSVKIFFVRLIVICLRPLIRLRKWIRATLLKYQTKLKIKTLRTAIKDADKDKAKTGRKNMVVYNTASGQFEPMQKKLLKNVAKAGKNKSNKAHTEGRLKMMQKRKKRILNAERVKEIEEKSLYVTK